MLRGERRHAVGRQAIGKVGSVTHRVRGGDRPGEVKVVVAGLPHHYLAFCPVEVSVGERVLVINVRGPREVDVEPWGDWAGDDVAAPGEAVGDVRVSRSSAQRGAPDQRSQAAE
jgi:hypothetical protein